MILALAQIDSVIGGFEQNRQKIIAFAQRAVEQHADLVLFPRWTVCGEPSIDGLSRESFLERNLQTVQRLQNELPQGIAVGIGFVNRSPHRQSLVDEYCVILDGKLVFEQILASLPKCGEFDALPPIESFRHTSFDFKGHHICFINDESLRLETDISETVHLIENQLDAETTFIAMPSAVPFSAGKHWERQEFFQRIARRYNVPAAYINAVGANAPNIFDGRSFMCNNNSVIASAKPFEEDLPVLDTSRLSEPLPSFQELLAPFDEIEQALVLGIRDYVTKCRFERCHLGLSGGIDSVLVAYLAVQAIGKDNVTCFNMPSRFSSQGSKDDSAALAADLGCRYEVLPIEPCFESFLSTLKEVFEERPFDVAEENLQARIRGTLMMAYSNKFHSMLLTTGNKSELAMGYCTLYGDMCGALAPIGDLFKSEVFALCRNINAKQGRNIISESVLTKPPSAELRPEQTDQDTLPPYEMLDEILKLYLFEHLSVKEIKARTGFDPIIVAKIIRSVALSEFKRRQAPPVLKVSPYPFGISRRMPIAAAVYETE